MSRHPRVWNRAIFEEWIPILGFGQSYFLVCHSRIEYEDRRTLSQKSYP